MAKNSYYEFNRVRRLRLRLFDIATQLRYTPYSDEYHMAIQDISQSIMHLTRQLVLMKRANKKLTAGIEVLNDRGMYGHPEWKSQNKL